MDKRTSQVSSCDALNSIPQEAQCNFQMFAPTMKEETIHCSEEKESNSDNNMCGYKSLKSPNCINYYDDQFCASVEVKGEFPEDECPQSSTAISCINKSAIYSNIIFENEELSKVVKTQDIKQEVSEEAFIRTGEIHDKKDQFVVTTDILAEYRMRGNAQDTSLLYKVLTTPQENQLRMGGGVLKNGCNSTHNNVHENIVPPTLVGNQGNELQKCPCCNEYFNPDHMLSHVNDVHSHIEHKSQLNPENNKRIHAGSDVDEIKYKCDSCKRIYKSKSALVLHFKKIHYSNGRLFDCWCGERFVTPRHLRQHKSRQHRTKIKSTNNTALEEEFKCDICKKKFKNEDILKEHVKSSHYDYGKTFKCWCGKQFHTPIHLYRHKAK